MDLANQRWVFQQSEEKNKQGMRVVYLTDPAIEIVRRLMSVYPEGPLFRNSEGRPWTADSVNCVFDRIRIRIGQRRLKRVVRPKDKRNRLVFVDEQQVEEAMKKMQRGTRYGQPKNDARLRHEARRLLTSKAARRSAPKYSLYALRHTWINRMLTSGVDALTVAILAGRKTMKSEKPIKIFRIGAIGASVWIRSTSRGSFYDVTVSRSWRGEQSGETGYSPSFSEKQLDALIDVAIEAKPSRTFELAKLGMYSDTGTVETNRMFFHQLHGRDRGDWLGHRGNPEDGVQGHFLILPGKSFTEHTR